MKKVIYFLCCLAAMLLFTTVTAPQTVLATDFTAFETSGNTIEFKGPTASVLDTSGNLYVTDYYNNRVVEFGTKGENKGKMLHSYGTQGNGTGQFFKPSGIAIDGSGYLYVADTYNNRIVRFKDVNANSTIEDDEWQVWDGTKAGGLQFNKPMGVYFKKDKVFVADTFNNRIVTFENTDPSGGNTVFSDGNWTTFGVKGEGDGQFNAPYDVALDSGDNMWISDTFNNRVQEMITNKGAIQWKTYPSNFNYGLAVDGNNVYVAERQNGCIRCLNNNKTYGDKSELTSPIGVNIDSNRILWVVDVTSGSIKYKKLASSGGGGGDGTTSGSLENTSPGAIPIVRVAGYDRFETAVAIAEQRWNAGAENVVLANGYLFPDALAAGPLAYKLDAPILLTDDATLTPSTLAEIKKLNPKKITLVGGTAVISQNIQDSLSATYGQDNVVRYSGIDRYATAAAIADALGTTGKAVIVNGEDGHYADALSISSYAAYNGIPILFTQASKLPAVTAQELVTQKVETTIVVGGEVVVTPEIFSQLSGASRYGGIDLYATATAVATGLHLNLDKVFVVTGLNFPDALVAGNLAAHTVSPLLMVDSALPEVTKTFLTTNKASIKGVTVVGGEGIITAAQFSAIQDALD